MIACGWAVRIVEWGEGFILPAGKSKIHSLEFFILRSDDSHLQLQGLEVNGQNAGETWDGRLFARMWQEEENKWNAAHEKCMHLDQAHSIRPAGR